MFEQELTDRHGLLRRPLAMTISFAGQAAVLTAVAFVSFLHTDSLPNGFLFTPVVAPGRPAQPSPPKTQTVTAVSVAKMPWRPFTAPAVIPNRIDMSAIDAPASAVDSGAIDTGVIGGIGLTDGRGVLPIDLPHPTPPAAKPVAAEKMVTLSSIPKPIAISSGVQAAKLIRQVNPPYPPLAKQARISGTVRLTAIIGRDGAIERLQLISGHPLLAQAAIEAVKQWVYRPTLLNETPVEVITQIDVNFTLSQ
jgi:protein TonB